MRFVMESGLSLRSALQYVTSENIAQRANIDELTGYLPFLAYHHILALSLVIAIIFSCE